MHGFAVMPQGFLREPLGVPNGFLARETHGAVLPIHVFALQIRSVALWFFAHRHGQLRGLVDAANGAGELVV